MCEKCVISFYEQVALFSQRRCGRSQTFGLVSRGHRLKLDHVQQAKRRRHERQSMYYCSVILFVIAIRLRSSFTVL